MRAMNSQASWAVENRGAYLKCGPLEGYAGCTADGLNFTVEKWNGRPLQGACIFMNAGLPRKEPEPFEVAELYIRGNDFIGNYSYGGAQRIAPQVYWRASEQD